MDNNFIKSQSWADAHDADEEEQFEDDHNLGRRESERSVEDVAPPAPVLPTKPPFKAYVGNIQFESQEQDIVEFLSPANVVEVNMIRNSDGKFRGFSYVEFKDLESLEIALQKNGNELFGREVKVTVAEERGRRDRTRGNFRRRGGGGGAYNNNNNNNNGDFRRRNQYNDRRRHQNQHQGYQDRGYNDRGNNNSQKHHQSYDQQQPPLTNPDINEETAAPPSKQRQRLQLKPRSQPKVDANDPNALVHLEKSPNSKPNPFGAAKPRELVLAQRGEKSPASIKPQQPSSSNNTTNTRSTRIQPSHHRNKPSGKKTKQSKVDTDDDFVKVEGKKSHKKNSYNNDRSSSSKKKNHHHHHQQQQQQNESNRDDVVAVNAFEALLLDEE